jgi:hypothetical protein
MLVAAVVAVLVLSLPCAALCRVFSKNGKQIWKEFVGALFGYKYQSYQV